MMFRVILTRAHTRTHTQFAFKLFICHVIKTFPPEFHIELY